MTVTPAFPAPVQVGTDGGAFVVGKVGMYTNPLAPEYGVQLLLFTNQLGGSYVRITDGAVGTLGSDQYVTIVPGSFVIA